ncbi:MAG: hypothetical protein AB7P04_14735 [Bacteriovoracia bacterium]
MRLSRKAPKLSSRAYARRRALGFFLRLLTVVNLLGLFGALGCANPVLEPTSEYQKQAMLAQANIYLSTGNCAGAIALMDALYNSGFTDNDVRMVRASAHGCNAGINFLPLVDKLGTANIAGPLLWRRLTEYFPYSSDSNLQSAWYATDSLMAALLPGVVIAAADEFNAGTLNPGSLKYTQRTSDSNLYMIFVSMANIGQIQNKRGAPDGNYQKTQNLPGTTSATVTEEGCSYAGSILNMIEGISATSTLMSGSVATSLTQLTTVFDALLKDACGKGCAGTAGSGCTLTYAECAVSCPIKLRTRTGCTNAALTDAQNPAKCAASGIINFINTDPFGWN